MDIKTNWVASDFINASDYNRISDNITEVVHYLSDYFYSVDYNMCDDYDMSHVSYSDYATVDKWNAITTVLYDLDTKMNGLIQSKILTWSEGDEYLAYDDLNYIEGVVNNAYNVYNSLRQNEKKLPIILGHEGEFNYG